MTENAVVAIALIGDGAMTAGMAFEALNHAGHLPHTRLLVVLNDNDMSISPPVGALSTHLNRMRHSPHGAVFKHPDYFDMYFTEEAVAELLARAGLEPVLKRSGSWRGTGASSMRRIGHQDLLILRRPE